MKLLNCRFAYSIRVGDNEHLFATPDKLTVELMDQFIVRLTDNRSKAVAYTSLFNIPYWTMDENEFQLESDGIPPAENLDIAHAPKNKGGRPKKVVA